MTPKFMGYVLAALLFLLAGAPAEAGAALSPRTAHDLASKGVIVLIDIRTPQEWRQTGIGQSATPISMHAPGFLERIATVTNGDKSKPIALICASGGRSGRMQKELTELGYADVRDVDQGMLGNGAGPGWIKSGMPTKPYAP